MTIIMTYAMEKEEKEGAQLQQHSVLRSDGERSNKNVENLDGGMTTMRARRWAILSAPGGMRCCGSCAAAARSAADRTTPDTRRTTTSTPTAVVVVVLDRVLRP